ncbi:methyl-accepting chemotaxis protein [Evansella cellulosilytica]|uniref:Methyl-accepting chemotaxis sensory transducer n=1 Tax=Evansella cellulosilytica (strain ATCC 21833 / DSM 2522 / FERM P-1141 / JCM 9156 / N-4) TaxID=649639 RepID=E6TTE8_EVAC2|nr:methyl-accepting chemotaxis protein [Evansella cellulosilytica]ADU29584.1 methyl-accepting chemotaxis sensory transducer [Evansella cellulosilytica DSM 2522]
MKALSIFKVGIMFMNRLSYIKKFSFILGLFLIPFLVVLFMLISTTNERIAVAEIEREGIEYISELRSIVQVIQQHRGLSVTYLQGGTNVRGDIEDRQQQVSLLVEEIDAVNDRLGERLQVEYRWDDIKNGWENIEENVFSYNANETIEIHGALIKDIVDFQMYIASTSNLILDPDETNYFLVAVLLQDFPNMVEYMGMSRATGTAVVNNKTMTTNENIELLFHLRSMENYLDAGTRSINFAFDASPEIENDIGDAFLKANEASEATIELIHNNILNTPSITLDSNMFFNTITESIDHVYLLMEEGTALLDNRLAVEIHELRLQNGTVIAIAIFTTLLIIYFFLSFYFGVRGTITHIKEKMEQFTNGDLTVRTELSAKDETKEIGIAFNKMSEDFMEMIQTNSHFSEQIAASSEELTASIDQTTIAVKHVTEIMDEVANGAELQVTSSNESAIASEKMAEGILKIAENASTVSMLSNNTTDKAKAGSNTVNESREQFQSIKDFVLQVSKVINDLSEHSKEISNITGLINGVAEQTNLLALNAAIEAARAGEHGKGFVVVAGEVRKLAEETKTSTGKISTIISEIQELVFHAVTSMEKGTLQVEAGTEIMEKLGDDFNEIVSAISEVSGQIHEVSAVSQQLSANSQQVAAAMNDLSSIANKNSSASQDVAASTEEQLATMEEINSSSSELSNVALKLSEQISRFKVTK